MILLSPCDRPEEVSELAKAGAHELYGGVRPDGWSSALGSPNQRTFDSAQFPSETSLHEAADEARRRGVAFHLVLNAPVYDPAAYWALAGLAQRAAGWGVSGVIAGDLGLLLRLSEAALPLTLTLSTLAGALNGSAVEFFLGLGVRRVVLPRHLTLGEVEELTTRHPAAEFEAFVLIGRCPNEEAWCSFEHVSPTGRWPCEIAYRLEDPQGRELVGGHPLARRQERWAAVDRRQGCGLCHLGALERAGVRHLKLVGRGAPTQGKVANLRLVARALQERLDPEEAKTAFREHFGRPCQPLNCYFPEPSHRGAGEGAWGSAPTGHCADGTCS